MCQQLWEVWRTCPEASASSWPSIEGQGAREQAEPSVGTSFEGLHRKEPMGLHADVGKKEISNHSFPTELSAGDVLYTVWDFGPPPISAGAWTIVRVSLLEGQRFQAPLMFSWSLGASLTCGVNGNQLSC